MGYQQAANQMQTGCIEQVGAVLVKRWGDGLKLHQMLYRALCELHIANQDAEGFTAYEIYDQMIADGCSWPSDRELEEQKVLIKAHWAKLESNWKVYEEGAATLAEQNGFEVYPVPERIVGGGTGNYTKYRLKLVDVEIQAELQSDDFDVRYVAATTKAMGQFVNATFGSNILDGWRRWALLTLMVVGVVGAYLFGVFAYMAALAADSRLIGPIILGCTFSLFLIALIRPFYKVLGDRLVLMPGGFFSSDHNRLLEFKVPPQVDKKMLRVVTYSGECPICVNSRVTVRTGSPERKGLLVGRCDQAPYAHVFSFDPVLLGGNRLI